jgi:hypothetical protein
MIKLLFWIFKKPLINHFKTELFLNGKNIKRTIAYVDGNGKRYLKYDDDFDIPIKRIQQLELRLKRVQRGLSSEDETQLLKACKDALNKGNKPDIARVGFIIEEMLMREEIIVHEDLWFDIIALTLIREDEQATEVDWTIHKEKVEQFKKEASKDMYSFFVQSGLGTYIPYLTKLEDDWNEFYNESRIRIIAMRKMLERFS